MLQRGKNQDEKEEHDDKLKAQMENTITATKSACEGKREEKEGREKESHWCRDPYRIQI